jgi:AcrR family transcriptional regulator
LTRLGDEEVAMARSGIRTGGRGSRSASTRARIVDAAIETLKREGYAGASARAIAQAGGVNQASIFYHFGSVTELLLAALQETSDRRMASYRQAMADAGTLPELVDMAARVFREDLEVGHITILAELIAGRSSEPELGPPIVEQIRPWRELTEEAARRVLHGSPLEALVPVRDVAYAVVALYVGLELLTHLDGDPSGAERLFEVARVAAPMLGALLGPGATAEDGPS